MFTYHFVDNATGLCVQSLRVLRYDMTHAQMDTELTASASKQSRKMVCLTCNASHVCAPGSAVL